MKILVSTNSQYGKECELTLDIDSKHTIYYLLNVIHSKCYVSDVPYLSKFTHNKKELQKSDLNMTIEDLFGNVEEATLMGYHTDGGALSPALLKEYRAQHKKTRASQKFNQSSGLTFFNPNLTDIIYEYYKEYPPYVVANIPHALNFPINNIHTGHEFSPKKTINLWSLVISFFYKMVDVQLSFIHPGQLIARGGALLKAKNKFISYHEDFESAEAACKKPMLVAEGNYFESLANYNLIFCLDFKGTIRGIFFNIYYPINNTFSEYLKFIDTKYLFLKSKQLQCNFSPKNLQASFANHLLKNYLVDDGLIITPPNFQGGRAIELQPSCHYADLAMNYFLSHQAEPKVWKKGVHTVDSIIKAALDEGYQGPNRKLILALLEEDSSWFENKEIVEIKWEIIEHFEQENLAKDCRATSPTYLA